MNSCNIPGHGISLREVKKVEKRPAPNFKIDKIYIITLLGNEMEEEEKLRWQGFTGRINE